jgi:hypothetical protein
VKGGEQGTLPPPDQTGCRGLGECVSTRALTAVELAQGEVDRLHSTSNWTEAAIQATANATALADCAKALHSARTNASDAALDAAQCKTAAAASAQTAAKERETVNQALT